jgi:hypothetical protein
MPRFTRYGLCFASVAAMALLIVAVRKQGADSTSASRAIDTWDIPELADHLNRMGIQVRLRAISRDGPLTRDGLLTDSAYLTTTAKEWIDLNSLCKDPKRIRKWRGTLYCERIGERDVAHFYIEQWGDHCLLVRPFLFYGDPELLERVRNALASIAPSTTP